MSDGNEDHQTRRTGDQSNHDRRSGRRTTRQTADISGMEPHREPRRDNLTEALSDTRKRSSRRLSGIRRRQLEAVDEQHQEASQRQQNQKQQEAKQQQRQESKQEQQRQEASQQTQQRQQEQQQQQQQQQKTRQERRENLKHQNNDRDDGSRSQYSRSSKTQAKTRISRCFHRTAAQAPSPIMSSDDTTDNRVREDEHSHTRKSPTADEEDPAPKRARTSRSQRRVTVWPPNIPPEFTNRPLPPQPDITEREMMELELESRPDSSTRSNQATSRHATRNRVRAMFAAAYEDRSGTDSHSNITYETAGRQSSANRLVDLLHEMIEKITSTDHIGTSFRLTEICQALLLSNEESLSGFHHRRFVTMMIRVLPKPDPLPVGWLDSRDFGDFTEENVVLACRALYALCEAIPAVMSNVATTTPSLIACLKTFNVIDVPEQALLTLEHLMLHGFGRLMLTNGVVQACMNIIDFLPAGAARSALNCVHQASIALFPVEEDYMLMMPFIEFIPRGMALEADRNKYLVAYALLNIVSCVRVCPVLLDDLVQKPDVLDIVINSAFRLGQFAELETECRFVMVAVLGTMCSICVDAVSKIATMPRVVTHMTNLVNACANTDPQSQPTTTVVEIIAEAQTNNAFVDSSSGNGDSVGLMTVDPQVTAADTMMGEINTMYLHFVMCLMDSLIPLRHADINDSFLNVNQHKISELGLYPEDTVRTSKNCVELPLALPLGITPYPRGHVVWQHADANHSYRPYDDTGSWTIEAGYHESVRRVHIAIEGKLYLIDIMQNLQINESNGEMKPIVRSLVFPTKLKCTGFMNQIDVMELLLPQLITIATVASTSCATVHRRCWDVICRMMITYCMDMESSDSLVMEWKVNAFLKTSRNVSFVSRLYSLAASTYASLVVSSLRMMYCILRNKSLFPLFINEFQREGLLDAVVNLCFFDSYMSDKIDQKIKAIERIRQRPVGDLSRRDVVMSTWQAPNVHHDDEIRPSRGVLTQLEDSVFTVMAELSVELGDRTSIDMSRLDNLISSVRSMTNELQQIDSSHSLQHFQEHAATESCDGDSHPGAESARATMAVNLNYQDQFPRTNQATVAPGRSLWNRFNSSTTGQTRTHVTSEQELRWSKYRCDAVVSWVRFHASSLKTRYADVYSSQDRSVAAIVDACSHLFTHGKTVFSLEAIAHHISKKLSVFQIRTSGVVSHLLTFLTNDLRAGLYTTRAVQRLRGFMEIFMKPCHEDPDDQMASGSRVVVDDTPMMSLIESVSACIERLEREKISTMEDEFMNMAPERRTCQLSDQESTAEVVLRGDARNMMWNLQGEMEGRFCVATNTTVGELIDILAHYFYKLSFVGNNRNRRHHRQGLSTHRHPSPTVSTRATGSIATAASTNDYGVVITENVEDDMQNVPSVSFLQPMAVEWIKRDELRRRIGIYMPNEGDRNSCNRKLPLTRRISDICDNMEGGHMKVELQFRINPSLPELKSTGIDDEVWKTGDLDAFNVDKLAWDILKSSSTDSLRCQNNFTMECLKLIRIVALANRYWNLISTATTGATPHYVPQNDLGSVVMASEDQFVIHQLGTKINKTIPEPHVRTHRFSDRLTDMRWVSCLIYGYTPLVPFQARLDAFYRYVVPVIRHPHRNTYVDTMSVVRADAVRAVRKRMTVSRETILKDAEAIFRGSDMVTPLEVSFRDEIGYGVGPTQEFFSLVGMELRRADLKLWDGYFTEKDPFFHNVHGLYPKAVRKSERYDEKKFRFLGKFVSKAFLDKKLVDIPLNLLVFKWLLRLEHTIGLDDMVHVDPEVYQHLKTLRRVCDKHRDLMEKVYKHSEDTSLKAELETFESHQGKELEGLSLDFLLIGSDTFELMKGGRRTIVTLFNLEDYIKLNVYWRLIGGVRRQMEALRDGFDMIIPLSCLRCFLPEEMSRMICGSRREKWTMESLVRDVECTHGYVTTSAQIVWLFEYLCALDEHEQKLFLQFLTGCPCLPFGGLRCLDPMLKIVPAGDPNTDHSPDNLLPSVMTCRNFLKLPPYTSKERLLERMNLAIHEGQNSFHLS